MKTTRRRRSSGALRAVLLAVASAVVGLGVAAGLVLAVLGLVRWISAHPYFAVRHVDVRGQGALVAADVVERAGLRYGMSLFDVDPAEMEGRLAAEPRIRAALVEKQFPRSVTVVVEERTPVGLLLGSGGPLFFDGDLRLFQPLPGESLDGFAFVTGITADAPGEADPAVFARLERAARVLERWRAHESWPALSEVRSGDDGEIVVFPSQNPMAIRFSAPVEADAFDRLTTLLDLWRGRESLVSGIDLSLPGQAVLRLRGALPAAKKNQGT